MQNSKYLPDATYHALLDGLLAAHSAFDARTRVIELLGEVADVWPDSIQAEAEAEDDDLQQRHNDGEAGSDTKALTSIITRTTEAASCDDEIFMYRERATLSGSTLRP
jgi:hypothetical protein